MLAVRLLPSASWVLRLWTARLMAQTSPRELVPPKPDDFVAGDFGQSWWLKLSNSQVIKKNWAPKPSNYGLDNIFNIAIRTLLAIPWYSVFLRQPQILFRFLRQTTSSANDLGKAKTTRTPVSPILGCTISAESLLVKKTRDLTLPWGKLT